MLVFVTNGELGCTLVPLDNLLHEVLALLLDLHPELSKPDSWGKLQPEYHCPDFCCLFLPLPTLSFTKTACESFKRTEVCFISSPNPVMINCFSHFEISAERVPVLFPRMQHHQHFSIIQIGFSLSSSPSHWEELCVLALPLISLTLM